MFKRRKKDDRAIFLKRNARFAPKCGLGQKQARGPLSNGHEESTWLRRRAARHRWGPLPMEATPRSMEAAPRMRRRCATSACHHARQTAGIRMTLPTAEQPVWHCGYHTAKLDIGRWLDSLLPTICCSLQGALQTPAAGLYYYSMAALTAAVRDRPGQNLLYTQNLNLYNTQCRWPRSAQPPGVGKQRCPTKEGRWRRPCPPPRSPGEGGSLSAGPPRRRAGSKGASGNLGTQCHARRRGT